MYQQDPRMYQDTRAWGMPIPVQQQPQQQQQQQTLPLPSQSKGFILHDTSPDQRYLNGGGGGGEHSLSSNQHHHISSYPATLFSQTPPSSASPQHRNAVSKVKVLFL